MDHDDPFATDPTGRLELSMVTAGLTLAARYRLEALLAQSRDVMTWRAADLILSRPVLIHLLGPEDERLGWVLQAARRAATVTDSRFLRVLDAMEAHGQEPWSFVVCEFAVGDSLQTLLQAGPLETNQAAFIGHEVAAALGPLHARGLFHLRLGPDAVIITPNGNVKIVGFLIDAALRPEPGEDTMSWSEQEALDVAALGKLLYATTTARWPVAPSEPQRPAWGLNPAPLQGLPPSPGAANEQLWPAPHELNRAIDPELGAVVMAMLRPGLGLVGPRLNSADDVADSLDSLAGTIEAEESLEALVRDHRGLAAPPAAPAVLQSSSGWGGEQADRGDQATQQMAPVFDDDEDDYDASVNSLTVAGDARTAFPRNIAPTAPTAVESEPTDDDYYEDEFDEDDYPTNARGIRAQPERPRPVPAPPRQPANRPNAGTLGRRWVLVLIGFIVVALAVLQFNGCRNNAAAPGDSSSPAGASSVEPTLADPGPLEVVSVTPFDPVADGGTDDENPDLAALAIDGDPATSWDTLWYLNNPVFGGLKPGVGLLYDLGEPMSVAAVSLQLTNEPNGIAFMVPSADPSAATPPLGSASEWQVVAENQAAGAEVTLAPQTSVTTRWVLVYFTHLPPLDNGQFASGIAETVIIGTPA